MKRVLIKCGWLVTLDPEIGEIKGGELLYRGNTIEAAGRNLGASADEVIDASDKIVMPGLVNAHMHTWETALRGIGAEWMSADYFKHVHSNLATRYKPEDNYVANLMGALAQIDAGVTTLVDWCHNITTIEHAERAVDGLVDSGIRAVFAHGTAKPIGLETGTPFTHVPHPRERIEALRKGRLASDDGRVTLAMAILGPDWGAWEVVEHDIRMAREFGLVSSSHTRRREDCVVPDGYARMAKAGLLGPDHNLVHGTSYDTADLRVVVDSGASLTSTVLVELHHHIGDTMVAAFREAGRAAVDRHRRRALLLGPDVPRDAGGAAVRARQGGAQQRAARQLAAQDDSGALPRGAGMGDDQRRQGVQARQQDRHALARQEGRHRHAARRRREHGAGLRSDLFDRRDRRRRQCRHRHHRRRRPQAERQADLRRPMCCASAPKS